MKIYHLTSQPQWQKALKLGEYGTESLKTEGFIHCCTHEQIPKVFHAFYRDKPDLVVLEITPEKLKSPVKWEAPAHLPTDSPPSVAPLEKFPHVYGVINVDAVVSQNFLKQDLY